MGLRCLLGHDFGEPETERERNEEGNEVVVTVREVKTCERCGEKQVVSENKEIKSIDQLRESATAGGTEPATDQPSAAGSADGWGTDGSVGSADEPTTEQSASGSADQWSTDELEVGGESAGSEPEETGVGADESDEVDRGVAEIIESAEKDDEMLQTDEGEPEEAEAAETAEPEDEEDETPVHPGQRSPDEEEEHDTSEEDAEILDDGSPPEEGREQWDEQADPAQVPGQDRIEAEPGAPEDEDALIMGEDDEEPAVEEPEPAAAEPAEPVDDEPTAVESEDAVILDDDSGEPEPAEPTEPAEPAETEPGDAVESEDAVIMEESTEESGHTPWPETPGEDEGHDATEPDGEPADVEFGGGITPEQPRNEENGSRAGASPDEPASEDASPGEPASGGAETGGSAEPAATGESGGERSPQPNIDLEQSSREARLEYYCPECGLTRDVGNSSMRAGDICPECRKGYITEQEKAE